MSARSLGVSDRGFESGICSTAGVSSSVPTHRMLSAKAPLGCHRPTLAQRSVTSPRRYCSKMDSTWDDFHSELRERMTAEQAALIRALRVALAQPKATAPELGAAAAPCESRAK